MPWLSVEDECCFMCGGAVEPGYHFCPTCRDAANRTPHPAPPRLVLPPVRIVECHPSDGPRLSAIGYRLVAETYDPDTGLVKVQAWAKTDGEG